MKKALADLLSLLRLEQLEHNLFRGESRDIGSPQVFGGQVLGQALMAASGTLEGRLVHSLHAYFLRRGDFNAPIVYEVDRSRDGGSFTSRRVVAIQHGQPIFNLAASFQIEEEGPDHQVPMPDVAPPEELPDLKAEVRKHLVRIPGACSSPRSPATACRARPCRGRSTPSSTRTSRCAAIPRSAAT